MIRIFPSKCYCLMIRISSSKLLSEDQNTSLKIVQSSEYFPQHNIVWQSEYFPRNNIVRWWEEPKVGERDDCPPGCPLAALKATTLDGRCILSINTIISEYVINIKYFPSILLSVNLHYFSYFISIPIYNRYFPSIYIAPHISVSINIHKITIICMHMSRLPKILNN